MKKLITVVVFLLSISAYSQPVMDGTFDGEAVWGAPKALADNNTGWFSSQAKKFYVTSDANYLYLGAEVTASHWMAWAFIINTKPGGATSDSWARRVYYNHPPDSNARPDFTARGHFNRYAEIYKWTGTAWQRDPDGGLDTLEFGESISGDLADGWVEIRVPQSTLGSPSAGDIQFYITGDNNEHGSFDACPDDDNATSWTDSTTLSNYKTNILFSKTLNLTALIQGFYSPSIEGTMVPDTVTVELRKGSAPYSLEDQTKVVLNPSGNASPKFYTVIDGTSYYIVIKHRNAMETWSATAESFTAGTLSYDFSTAQNKALGNNMKQVGSSWCFYVGDVNQDGFIETEDLNQVYNDNIAGVEGPYVITDLNFDTFVETEDLNLVFDNNIAGVEVKRPLDYPLGSIEVAKKELTERRMMSGK